VFEVQYIFLILCHFPHSVMSFR